MILNTIKKYNFRTRLYNLILNTIQKKIDFEYHSKKIDFEHN